MKEYKGFNVKKFGDIREMFADEESKEVYDSVVYYNYTKEFDALQYMIKKYYRSKGDVSYDFCDLIERNREEQKEEIIIFGASYFGQAIYDVLQQYKIKVTAFCDNFSKDKIFCGLPVILPEKAIENNPNAVYLVSAISYWTKMEMYEQLGKLGVDKDKRVLALTYYGNQYFEEGLVVPAENEIFIDGGSLDCCTCKVFSDWTNGKYKEILTFEPDAKNYVECEKNIENFKLHDVRLYPYGLWNEKSTLSFAQAGGGSSITPNGDVIINTISIDEVLKGKRCSFIKMDIEGAELNALKGARETIMQYRPKLAISVYHKPEDMIEIPTFINNLGLDYKLYLRHYSSVWFETVLYAL